VVNTTPRSFYPRERPGTHCIEGWVGPRAGLDGRRKSRPHRDTIPDGPAYNKSQYRLRCPGSRCIRCRGYVIWGETWWSVGNEEWIAMRKEMILVLFLGVSNKFRQYLTTATCQLNSYWRSLITCGEVHCCSDRTHGWSVKSNHKPHPAVYIPKA
jgi:hypothetical protein